MDAHRCIKCKVWWSSQSGDTDRFEAITRWCPNCLPVVLPRVHLKSPRPKWADNRSAIA